MKTNERPMRVLMASTSYPRDITDWRGIFIRHLVAALARAEDIELRLWAPPGELPRGTEAATLPAETEWLAHVMDTGGISHLIRHPRLATLFAPLTLLRMLGAAYRRENATDIYHINWLQCALPLPNNGIPALVSVLGNDMKLLQLPIMRALLRRIMRSRKVALCPNAEWMQEPLEAAFGDLASVIPVSFGIDPCWYALERIQPSGRPMWLVVSRVTAGKLGPLFEWSEPLFRNANRELHLFGPMQEPVDIPIWVQYHGPAAPEQLCREWFPRACGLITLSQHAEGRPQVMLEAMAAGLPIIASRTAAHAAIVVDDETGALCDSPQAFGDALHAMEGMQINRKFSAAARRWTEQRIGTWDDCAKRYRHVYRRLLKRESSD